MEHPDFGRSAFKSEREAFVSGKADAGDSSLENRENSVLSLRTWCDVSHENKTSHKFLSGSVQFLNKVT